MVVLQNIFSKPCLIIFLSSIATFATLAEETAKELFDQNAPMVFQVKIIDKVSGNKEVIGSGFQVSPTGVVATNYHVVSHYILEKEKYAIELIDHEENRIDASIINFDIVHDLALLQVEGLPEKTFQLNDEEIANGSRIYSMGNPHDLGMTIIEGNYNGLVEGSRYRKYLFSGSLNGGMSGGPALNGAGEIIGVNVSKGGEQISFLVPVKHLMDLMTLGYEPLDDEEYNNQALDFLIKDQNEYFAMLNDIDWLTRGIHSFELPDKIHDSLKCWGHTLEKKKKLYDETHRHCRTEDRIYLKSGFYTGKFSFDYEVISTDELNTLQFFSLLEKNYVISRFSNNNDKDDTTNFECVTSFMRLGDKTENKDKTWKVTTCIREYIKYRGLYDAGIIAMQADTEGDRPVSIKIYVETTGIDKNNISNLHGKFLRSIKWKK